MRVVSGDGQSGTEVLLRVNGTGTENDDFTVCLRHKLKMVLTSLPSAGGWFMSIRDV